MGAQRGGAVIEWRLEEGNDTKGALPRLSDRGERVKVLKTWLLAEPDIHS